ncbi:MAG: hypothetical protein AVDCRST_MAG55-1705, partial [uncultured Rubrobacteraceae bacterium]
ASGATLPALPAADGCAPAAHHLARAGARLPAGPGGREGASVAGRVRATGGFGGGRPQGRADAGGAPGSCGPRPRLYGAGLRGAGGRGRADEDPEPSAPLRHGGAAEVRERVCGSSFPRAVGRGGRGRGGAGGGFARERPEAGKTRMAPVEAGVL